MDASFGFTYTSPTRALLV